MTDITLIEAAEARHKADPGRIDIVAREALTLATIAGRRHPLGHAEIYAEVNVGLRNASFYPLAGERLLAVEAVHAAMEKRQAEAVEQIEKDSAARDKAAVANRLAIVSGGCVSRPVRDASLLEAINVAKLRLDNAWPKLSQGSEEDFQAVCDDLTAAVAALMATTGQSRRYSRARVKSAAAAEAVAAAKAIASGKTAPPEAA